MNSEIKKIKLSDIKPYSYNIKKHTKEQIELIKRSILENGYIQNIAVDKDNIIVIGHGRALALREINPDADIEVIDLSHLTDKQCQKLRIIDNKSNESEWNYDNSEKELEKIYGDLEKSLQDIMQDMNFDNEFCLKSIGLGKVEEKKRELKINKMICPKCGMEILK